jgi:WD40 repeat protein
MAEDDSPPGREIIPEDTRRQISLPPEMVRKGLELAKKLEGEPGNTRPKTPLRRLPGAFQGACIDFSGNGEFAAIICYGKQEFNPGLMVWNLTSGDLSILPEAGYESTPYAARITSNLETAMRSLESSSVSGFKISLDLSSNRPNGNPDAIPKNACSVAISKNGDIVLVGFEDGAIRGGRIMNSVIGQLRLIAMNLLIQPVTVLAVSPDNHLIVAASGDSAHLVDPVRGKEIRRFQGRNPYCNQIAFSDDGSELLMAHGEPRSEKNDHVPHMTLFDLRGEKPDVVFGGDRARGTASVAISSDNRTVVSLDEEEVIAVWDAVTGGEISHWSHAVPPSGMRDAIGSSPAGRNANTAETDGPARGSGGVAVSPDGERILTGGADRCMRLWTKAGKEIAEFPHDTRVVKVAFCPDGRRALSGGWDGSVSLWDVSE